MGLQTGIVQHQGGLSAETNRRPSPALWKHLDFERCLRDPSHGRAFFHDFHNGRVFASATVQDSFKTYQDTGVTVQNVDDVDGILEIAGADADNDEGSIEWGAGLTGFFKFASAAKRKAIFEARLYIDTLADRGTLLALAEPGTAAADALTDNDANPKDADLLGFHADTAAPSALDAIHSKNGDSVAQVVVQAGIHTFVAATYVKLGILLDPDDINGQFISFWVNGVRGTGHVTDLSLATFPDGEELAPVLAIKAGEGVEKKARLDWWRGAQLI